MRRSCAALLLGVFGLIFLLPLLQAAQGDASLPACCRRDGRHHCAMSMAGAAAAAATHTPVWQAPAERCPLCPATLSAAWQHSFGLQGTTFTLTAPDQETTAQSAVRSSAGTPRRAGPSPRGPPSLQL